MLPIVWGERVYYHIAPIVVIVVIVIIVGGSGGGSGSSGGRQGGSSIQYFLSLCVQCVCAVHAAVLCCALLCVGPI